MKRIVIIISLVCSICSMSAQNTLKCVYQEKYVNNANQPDKFTYDEHVLAIWETVPPITVGMHDNMRK